MAEVRAFQSYGQCRECGWVGGLDDGMCILCSNLAPDPWATAEAITGYSPDSPGLHTSVCVYCGADTEMRGELCRRCHSDISAVTEAGWRDRYVS